MTCLKAPSIILIMKYKKPTLKEKVLMYESFLHKINMYCITGDQPGIAELVKNADRWSYMHRAGEFTRDSHRDRNINNAFMKLCDTPETDANIKKRQEKYSACRS